jgi:rubredoxin
MAPMKYDLIKELTERGFTDISLEHRILNNRKRRFVLFTCQKHKERLECIDSNILRCLKENSQILSCHVCKTEEISKSRRNCLQDNEDKINCSLYSTDEYKNENELYSWQCRACGHVFDAKFADLKKLKDPCNKCKTLRKIKELEDYNISILNVDGDTLYKTDVTEYEFRFNCCGAVEPSKVQTLKQRKYICKKCTYRQDSSSGWLSKQGLHIDIDKPTNKTHGNITCTTCDKEIGFTTIDALKKRLKRHEKQFICCEQ